MLAWVKDKELEAGDGMGGCSRYIMGRRKKALRKLVKKSNKSISTLKTGCVSGILKGDGFNIVSLTRLSHSQERVWYITVQLIVLADSGCRVYTRSRSTQTAYTFGGKTVWNKPLHCKVPDSLSGEGVARETRFNSSLSSVFCSHRLE